MALVYTRQQLSGSTNGRPVEVATVASPGTTLHTVQATATVAFEEVHIYAVNRATAIMPVTIEFGGTATTDQILAQLPAQDGLSLIMPGVALTATTSIVRAFTTGTATDAIAITGWVNRAT